MDYNKRRWLERQQQKQQGEKPRKEYEAIRHTYFSKQENYYYVADVKVFERYSTIDLSIERCEQEINAPFWAKFFLSLLESGDELEGSETIVPTRVISNSEIVKHVIKRMITDYEIALYQQYMVMEENEDLEIEYDKELRSRLQRRPKIIDEEQTQQTFQQDYEINDYLSSGEELTEEEKKEQRVQELAARDGVAPEKYRNLLPFQSKKSG